MHSNVSDHALLWLESVGGTKRRRKIQIKFLNSYVDFEGFLKEVETSWNKLINGRPMYVLWKKLQRFQPILKELSKPFSDIKVKIIKAKDNLLKAQMELGLDRMNADNLIV